MRKIDTSKFIEKAKMVHGDLYIYEKTQYVAAKKKVVIACKKHGDFLQTPDNHTQGSGCPMCNKEKIKHLTHGLSRDPLYRVWVAMMKRCNDKNWKSAYKYEGIEVSKNLSNLHFFINYARTIEGYDSFIKGLQYSLDRIDTYKGYEEGNIRFASYSTQSINQKLRRNNKTGYVGIHIYKNGYSASVEHNGKQITKKPFADIKSAIEWRNNTIDLYNLPNKKNIYNEAKTV